MQIKTIEKRILDILIEFDGDEGELKALFLKEKDSFFSIVSDLESRSDVRGYAAKLLIADSAESCRDNLIKQILLNDDSLIRFGIIYGLEEIGDYKRIASYFSDDPNKRIRATILEIITNWIEQETPPSHPLNKAYYTRHIQ